MGNCMSSGAKGGAVAKGGTDAKFEPAALTQDGNVVIQAHNFVTHNAGALKDFYRIGHVLGTGAYGQVRQCVHKDSGECRAVKVILRKSMNETQTKKLLTEVQILRQMDHPNILKMYEFFEDDRYYYIITDFCGGGELFDEIINRKSFNEKDAMHLLKAVISTVNYCHTQNVAHRDLKPENVLLERSKALDQIKIIDFGTACKASAQGKFSETVGTPYYIAPEVLNKSYTVKCDIWSCGVIAYILLSGEPPFAGEDDNATLCAVKRMTYKFHSTAWKNISQQAKSFVSKLLVKESDRPTAQEALKDSWFAKDESGTGVDSDVAKGALQNLRGFNANCKLKQATFAFIAAQLVSQQEKEEIARVFRSLDVNGDGKLSKEEIKNGYLEQFGRVMTDQEVQDMFDQVDIDGSGELDYSEFVIAAMKQDQLMSKERLRQAFSMFDKDQGGTISREEIKQVLSFGNNLDAAVVEKIVDQVDENGDGSISFEEFMDMMLKDAVAPPK